MSVQERLNYLLRFIDAINVSGDTKYLDEAMREVAKMLGLV